MQGCLSLPPFLLPIITRACAGVLLQAVYLPRMFPESLPCPLLPQPHAVQGSPNKATHQRLSITARARAHPLATEPKHGAQKSLTSSAFGAYTASPALEVLETR